MSEVTRKIVDADNVRPYRSPRQKRQVLIAVVVVLLVALLGAGGYAVLAPRKHAYVLRGSESTRVERGDLVETTQASGTVALPTRMSLTSPESGYAQILWVAEGETVRRGQALARIDVPDLVDDQEDLESSLESARRAYEKTVAQNDIAVARSAREIESLGTDIATATVERDRLARLVEVSSSRRSELETAQASLDRLVSQRKEKQLQLEENRKLYELEELSGRSGIADLETKIRRLDARIQAATIVSPMDGEVLEISSLLSVPGSVVAAGATLFTIADPTSAIAELEVPEQYSGVLTPGQPVKLSVGSSTLTGRITTIGKVAQQSSDGLGATVSVKVKPVDDAVSLILGNTVVGTIDLATRVGVLLVERGPYLTTGSQRYVYRVDGDVARKVAVTFGSTQGTTVEILEGVEAGDEIITSGYQNYIEYDEVVLEKGD